MRPFLLILLTAAMGACVSTPPATPISDLLSADQQKALLAADVILLGEQHDNPHHHAIQHQILDFIGQKSLLGSVVFEQVNWDQQSIVSGLNQETLGRLEQDLVWSKSGWPAYSMYEPLFATAVAYRAQVIAGNVAPQKSKAIYKEGYSAIFQAEEQKALGLKEDLAPPSMAALRQEIFEGHCKMVPPDHVNAMIPVQRTRDAAMALAWSRLHKQGKTVYIVGSGHARKDYGIPWYLLRLQPTLKIYSIALNETDTTTEAAVYDQIITTAAAKREDPCAGLKEKFSKPAS